MDMPCKVEGQSEISVLGQLGIPNIIQVCHVHRLRWFGHLERGWTEEMYRYGNVQRWSLKGKQDLGVKRRSGKRWLRKTWNWWRYRLKWQGTGKSGEGKYTNEFELPNNFDPMKLEHEVLDSECEWVRLQLNIILYGTYFCRPLGMLRIEQEC